MNKKLLALAIYNVGILSLTINEFKRGILHYAKYGFSKNLSALELFQTCNPNLIVVVLAIFLAISILILYTLRQNRQSTIFKINLYLILFTIILLVTFYVINLYPLPSDCGV